METEVNGITPVGGGDSRKSHSLRVVVNPDGGRRVARVSSSIVECQVNPEDWPAKIPSGYSSRTVYPPGEAREFAELRASHERLRSALQLLVDQQSGPPKAGLKHLWLKAVKASHEALAGIPEEVLNIEIKRRLESGQW